MRAIAIVLGVFLGIVGLCLAQPGTCGGDCLTSEQCALEAGSLECRCSWLRCRVIPNGQCGGGCLTDSQCAQWAGGNPNCVCGTFYECVTKEEAAALKHQKFARFMQSIHGPAHKEKVKKLMEQLNQNHHSSRKWERQH